MNKLTKILSIGFCLALLFISSKAVYASAYNYGTTTEAPWPGLYYDGYVQIKPSYNDSGYHAARGYFWYTNTQDTSTYCTSYGNNQNDGTVYTASKRVYDSLNPIAPKAGFFYDFDWIPHNAGYWPI